MTKRVNKEMLGGRSKQEIAEEVANMSQEFAKQVILPLKLGHRSNKDYARCYKNFMEFKSFINTELCEETFVQFVVFYLRVYMIPRPAKSTVRSHRCGIEFYLNMNFRGSKFWQTSTVWNNLWFAAGFRANERSTDFHKVLDSVCKGQDYIKESTESAYLADEDDGDDDEDHLPLDVQDLIRGAVTELMLEALLESKWFRKKCRDYGRKGGLDSTLVADALRVIFWCAFRKQEFFNLRSGKLVGGILTVGVNKANTAVSDRLPDLVLKVLPKTLKILEARQKEVREGKPLYPRWQVPYDFLNELISEAGMRSEGLLKHWYWSARLKFTLHSLRHGGLQALWAMRESSEEKFSELCGTKVE